MNAQKKYLVTIPCSKCGDTFRIHVFNIEAGHEIQCTRCEQYFIPTDALVDSIRQIKEALARDSADQD